MPSVSRNPVVGVSRLREAAREKDSERDGVRGADPSGTRRSTRNFSNRLCFIAKHSSLVRKYLRGVG